MPDAAAARSPHPRQAPLTVICADGYALRGAVFEPDRDRERGATVVIAPAMLVRQRFYHAFAGALSDAGYRVLSVANRGMGVSLRAEDRPWDHALRHWGERDLPAIFAAARAARPDDRLFVVGHSMGGQLLGLSAAIDELDGIVTVAATSAYWGHWPFPANVGILAWYGAVVPAAGRLLRRFPFSRLNVAPDIDSRLVRDWARWGRDPDYVRSAAFGLADHLGDYRGRVLVYSFADDGFGVRPAIRAMHAAYRRAEVVERHVDPRDIGARELGHFGYFRRKLGAPLWDETVAWLEGDAVPG